jgi:hypothetical protein
MALAEQLGSSESIEALCECDGQPGSTPGLIVLDPRFPIWIALLEDTACVTVDTELLDGNPRARVRRAFAVIEFLRSAGYPTVVDGDTNRVNSDGLTERDVATAIATAGRTHWFGTLLRDLRFTFLFGCIAFACFLWIRDALGSGVWRFHSAYLVGGLVFGTILTPTQYWYGRWRLNQRLEGMRQEIVSDDRFSTRTFTKSIAATAVELFAVFLFGGFATISFVSGVWAVGLFLGAYCYAAAMFLVLGFRRVIVLRPDAIETRVGATRTCIPYGEVRQVVQLQRLDTSIVSSNRAWLLIPSGFDQRGQLATTLWDRIEAAREPSAAEFVGDTDDLQRRCDAANERSRRLVWHDLAWPPLWSLIRRHPLRRQYFCQLGLLRRGRVVLSRVVIANRLLYRQPREEARFDAPAIVLYVVNGPRHTPTSAVLDRMANRFSSPEEPAAAWFNQTLSASRGVPLACEVPRAFSDGVQAYVTTVMVVRRHIPLGSLRDPWLPLLVSPEKPSCMVLPERLWNTDAMRDVESSIRG